MYKKAYFVFLYISILSSTSRSHLVLPFDQLKKRLKKTPIFVKKDETGIVFRIASQVLSQLEIQSK